MFGGTFEKLPYQAWGVPWATLKVGGQGQMKNEVLEERERKLFSPGEEATWECLNRGVWKGNLRISMLPGGPSPLPFLGRDAYPPNPKSENHPIETLPWAHSLLFIQYSCCNLQSFNFTSSPSPLPALETARETEIDPNSQACL